MDVAICMPFHEHLKVPRSPSGFSIVSFILLVNPSLVDLAGWLSPELYLRRPPMKNEQYRVDRMLQAAAQRGVHVNIIVYKEVRDVLHCSCGPVLTVSR